jgi:opacity protein-like surface antigen
MPMPTSRLSSAAYLVTMMLLTTATDAAADLTAFIGAGSSPSSRLTTGASLGAGILIVGFEVEYAQTGADDDCFGGSDVCAPSLRTGMINVLAQTPRGVIPRLQLYGTVGAGYFRERFESLDIQETGFGTNLGGGVKIDLAGPLRLRLDYRIFKLSGDAVYQTPQRFYAGANLAF